jgi:hypothetical protein
MPTYEDPGIDWPLMQSQVNDAFGDPNYHDWADTYIVFIDLSEFRGDLGHLSDFHQGNRFGFAGNYILDDPIKKALKSVVGKGLAKQLHTFEGCFNIRPMKGNSNEISMHGYGLALDFNAAENAFGHDPKMSLDVVKCFSQEGFEWGGLWKPNQFRDGMHFQLPLIKIRTGPYAAVPYIYKA